MLVRVLLSVDRRPLARRLERLIAGPHVFVTTLQKPEGDLTLIDREDFDIVVISRELLGERAETIISRLRSLPERPEVVVLSGNEDATDRAHLLAAGSLAVVNQELPDPVLREMLVTLGRRRREAMESRLSEPAAAPDVRARLQDFSTRSPAMQQFMSLARRVVDADSSLLLMGETGVGKEWLARAVHSEGKRAGGPFVAVNCGAVPESLLESELFGHEKGAFTGAGRARRGYFELAHRGTLFLDEIADLPLHLQVKLLRAVQDRLIMRIGSERPVNVDVRVMAATNRNLDVEMETGRFRADLYYRLSVVTLTLPPLRDRPEDVPTLANSYLSHFRALLGRPVDRILPEAMETLSRYSWPGNVRELINTIERAVLLASGAEIGLGDLPRRIVDVVPESARAVPAPGEWQPGRLPSALLDQPLRNARRTVVEAFERDYIGALLNHTHGRIRETARRAGINERTLWDLMRRHQLRKETFKNG